jgi:hypothetical protein
VLTHAERSAGKWWRAQRDAELKRLNAEEPVNEHPPPVVRHIRHLCPGIAGRSVSFDYAEAYVTSPRIGVCYCSVIKPVPDELLGKFPHEDCAGGTLVPAGRFGYVYREGRCAGCGHTARSLTGRVVDGIERLPTGRKVIAG